MIEARPDCKADSTGCGPATDAERVRRRLTFHFRRRHHGGGQCWAGWWPPITTLKSACF